MRSIAVTLIAAGVLMQPACKTQRDEAVDTSVKTAGDWEVLFDGTNLDRWRGYRMDVVPGGWSVAESVIHCEGSGVGDLTTRDQWSNFELMLDWRISDGGNSGIIYRASEDYGAAWMTGPEMQILDNAGYDGTDLQPVHMAGAAYDMYAPAQDATRPVGQWNQTRIVVDGNHVEHWLNGSKIVEYDLQSDDWVQRVAGSKWAEHKDYGRVESGHIALQDHGDEVWFRNIRIRELPGSE